MRWPTMSALSVEDLWSSPRNGTITRGNQSIGETVAFDPSSAYIDIRVGAEATEGRAPRGGWLEVCLSTTVTSLSDIVNARRTMVGPVGGNMFDPAPCSRISRGHGWCRVKRTISVCRKRVGYCERDPNARRLKFPDRVRPTPSLFSNDMQPTLPGYW